MKKFLKIGLGSFVFILMFVSFTGFIFAKEVKYEVGRTTKYLGHDPDSGRNLCQVTITYSDGSTYTVGGEMKGDGTKIWCDTRGYSANKNPQEDGIYGGGAILPTTGASQVFDAKTPVLGNKNNTNVKKIQLVLKNEGLISAVDGNYGSMTKSAITKFQKKYKLPASGTINKETKALLITKFINPDEAGVNSVSAEGDIPLPNMGKLLDPTTSQRPL
ncbi:MAG: binding 1 protein [Patescibacteria group bacterium]|nr:binding 1 protein [Patescibacteria group bacterium]